jgi:NAD(P)-dependent dehydrogenase (short-subunit alcohol dehydrogenase family)
MSGLADLRGKVAIVTGGASGIGKGIATQFVRAGLRVVIADIEDEALQKTAAEVGAAAVRTDVSDLASVQALATTVCDRFGTVHVLCNNAGVGPMANLSDVTIADWRWMIGVNLWGVIHGVQTFLPILKANADGGHIVNTASVGGFVTMPGLGTYTATKYAVIALTETLAQELALENSKVGVTALCPGTTRTNIKNSLRNRPRDLGSGKLLDVDLEQQAEFRDAFRWLEPTEVGAIVVEAIRRGDLYAITHPEMFGAVEQRFQAITDAFRRAGS